MSSFQMNQYYRMCADIELLDKKIALYYLEHESRKNESKFGLPILEELASTDLSNVAITEGNANYNPKRMLV